MEGDVPTLELILTISQLDAWIGKLPPSKANDVALQLAQIKNAFPETNYQISTSKGWWSRRTTIYFRRLVDSFQRSGVTVWEHLHIPNLSKQCQLRLDPEEQQLLQRLCDGVVVK